MNYVLQVVRGRSASTTLKLADGVTSIGRHDDCLIRIKSSQVSRRHCELFEASDKLTIRDLGSSNGTFVNGKKVTGQQALKPGDELTVGAVTLRVAKIGQAAVAPASPISKPKAADTAVLDAITAEPEPEQEEFEMEFDDGDPEPEVEGIPLLDDDAAKPAKPKPAATAATATASATPASGNASSSQAEPKEDDAVAQFLLDLKLDDED
jgi:predicted component of type VI protein secretion system